jgi:5'-nucleotidase
MRDTGVALSQELRDPNGEHKCDIVIALTHARVPNDIDLANELGAVEGKDVASEHGVDLLIGGHDHVSSIAIMNDVADFQDVLRERDG